MGNENNMLKKNNGKRRSLLKQDEILNSSLINEINDDDSERRTELEHERLQRKLSDINKNTTPVANVDFKSQFDICIKLYAENKINAKNAWYLNIIDLMNFATSTHKDPLQIGSTSLDVGAKVYGIRVDDVYADGLKLASSIINSEKNVNGNPDDVEGDCNDECNQSNIKNLINKKKRRKLRFKNTTAKTSEIFSTKVPKLESTLFQSRLDTELSVIENLCTFKLPIDHSGYKFMLLSNEKAWPSSYIKDMTLQTFKNLPLELSSLSIERICEAFVNFNIDEWNEENNLNDFDKHKLQNSIVLNNITQPLLDKSIPEIIVNDAGFEDINDDFMNNELYASEICGEVNRILPDLREDITFQPLGENNNSNRKIEFVWAGPSHWKLKCIKSAKAVFTGHSDKTVVRNRNKITVEKINFDNENLYPHLNFKSKIKQKRPIVSKMKLLLPVHKETNNLANRNKELMSKSGTFIVAKKSIEDSDDEIHSYEYNNPNDSLYCSFNTSKRFETEEHEMEVAENDNVFSQGTFLGDNLIHVPEMISIPYISYAMQAKRMDMKKLKSVMWTCMSLNQNVVNDNVEQARKADKTKFSDLYQKLPLKLNIKMKEELSVPLAFVGLLHLANEHNLSLIGQSDLKDFEISLQL